MGPTMDRARPEVAYSIATYIYIWLMCSRKHRHKQGTPFLGCRYSLQMTTKSEPKRYIEKKYNRSCGELNWFVDSMKLQKYKHKINK